MVPKERDGRRLTQYIKTCLSNANRLRAETPWGSFERGLKAMEVVFPSENSRQDADSAFPPAHGRIGGGVRVGGRGGPGETTENLFCRYNWGIEKSVRPVPNLPDLGLHLIQSGGTG